VDARIVKVNLESRERGVLRDLSDAYYSMALTSNGLAYLFNYEKLLPINLDSFTGNAQPIHITRDDKEPCRLSFAITPDNAWAYVVTGRDSITPIKLSTRQFFPAIQVGRDPAHVAMAPDGKRAYVANHEGKSITPIDLQTRQALSPIQLDQKPSEVAVSSDGKMLVVLSSKGRELLMISIN
jgi:YVTN family beta-propeller protein